MDQRMKLRGALAAAGLAAVLAGCGGGSSAPQSENDVPAAADLATLQSQESSSAAVAPQTPMKPVKVLGKVPNCAVKPGVTTGEYDIVGALFADCTLTGEDIEVEARCVTDQTHDEEQALGTVGQPSTDSSKKILDKADNCFVEVRSVYGDPVPSSRAETIAFQLGGTYLPPA